MGKREEHNWIPVFGALIFILSMLASCSRTQYVPVNHVRIDSVTVHDTAFMVKLTPYRDSIVTRDTISYLSNEYAYSQAVWSDGHLHHSLGIWPTATVCVRVPYFIDRYIYRSVPQIVEKKLSWWERTKLQFGGYSIAGIMLLLAVTILKSLKSHN